MSAAVIGSNYVPPFAPAATTSLTITDAVSQATSTSLSFAKVGTLSGVVASGAATQTYTAQIVDSSGAVDSASLLEYFTKPYFDAHTLSRPSWRYAYIFWLVVAFILVVWTLAYQFGGPGSGLFAACFRKWSIRRIVVRGKVQQPGAQVRAEQGRHPVMRRRMWASPTIANMLVIVGLVVMSICLSVLGDDYISPTTCTFGGTCPYNLGHGSTPPPSAYDRLRLVRSLTKYGNNNPNGWAPFNDPLLSSPNYNVAASWWSAADRLGLISYAMFPLAITLILKQWPFNFWASPFLTNCHFDKTAILHRWSGRVIWLFSSAHTATWTYELFLDKDPFGRSTFIPAWDYWRFLGGVVAYALLTLMVILSFKPIRDRHYELFYWSHVVLVMGFLAGCLIHSKPLMGWPISALGLWGAERLTRLIIFAYVNGYGRVNFRHSKRQSTQSFSMKSRQDQSESQTCLSDAKSPESYPPMPYDRFEEESQFRYPSPQHSGKRQSFYNFGPGQDQQYLEHHNYPRPCIIPTSSTTPLSPSLGSKEVSDVQAYPRRIAKPPPGYATAQLLPGRTIRLTINVPCAIRWRPGQHIFLTIPSVRFLQAHPYTITSVDQRSEGIAPSGGRALLSSEGSELVLLIRAQKGFSKDLWDYVAKNRQAKGSSGAPTLEIVKGVSMRALVSLPLGSAGRVTYDDYESLLIICGGTGITFGIAVLEHACRRMARVASLSRARHGTDAKLKTRRIRFVWILKEFSHLSWVAPTLRRCLELSSASQLQVDIFVSRGEAPARHRPDPFARDLAPPTPAFARGAPRGAGSRDSFDSDCSDSDAETAPRPRASADVDNIHIDSITETILFDGEDETAAPGEEEISSRIRQEGKLRRARSRHEQGYRKSESAVKTPQTFDSYANGRPQFAAADVPFLSRSAGSATSYQPQSYDGSVADLTLGGDDPADNYSFIDGSSIRQLVGGSLRSDNTGHRGMEIDLSPSDQEDLNVVAELARPGHPRLDRILDEEVSGSAGRTMVACCGPQELNTLVRHLVSDRIDLRKVFEGDPTGDIALILEDFSF